MNNQSRKREHERGKAPWMLDKLEEESVSETKIHGRLLTRSRFKRLMKEVS